jgi:hypothetical protein
MKKILFSLLLTNLIVGLFFYLLQGYVWFMNAQVAFFSSSLVMLASMFSYSKFVQKGVEAGVGSGDNRDTLDKLEDPYDLYDETEPNEHEEPDLKEVVAQERANLKKSRRSMLETAKDVKSSFSFYRLSAYALLVLGFFYLNSNNILTLIPYLISLSLPPLVILFILMRNNSK